ASCGRSRRASSLSQPSPSRTASSKEFLPRATLSQPSGRTSFAIMSDRLQQMLAERPFLLADGATRTNLFAAGLMRGEATELWNFEHPERVEALHQSMVDAGADIILTNSFGGSAYRLKLHNKQDQVREINREAARIARRVADRAGRPVLVAGSMGPSGELFQPLGALTHDEAAAAFAAQAAALVEGGVDLLWIETMAAREELQA